MDASGRSESRIMVEAPPESFESGAFPGSRWFPSTGSRFNAAKRLVARQIRRAAISNSFNLRWAPRRDPESDEEEERGSQRSPKVALFVLSFPKTRTHSLSLSRCLSLAAIHFSPISIVLLGISGSLNILGSIRIFWVFSIFSLFWDFSWLVRVENCSVGRRQRFT